MRISLSLFLLFLSACSYAQDFSGYKTSDYQGVTSVFTNPANIAGSRYRWDVNLFSLSSGVGNDKASFRFKDLKRSIDGDSLRNKVFGGAKSSNGLGSAVFQGPSFFFNLNKKSALAFTSRARVMTNISNLDGALAQRVISDANAGITYPYTINSTEDMFFNVNAWTEFGASYAREIMSRDHHFLKGGLTLKYLAGVANAYVDINSLKGTLNNDIIIDEPYLTNASGRIGLGFGGVNIDNFEAGDLLKFRSTGIGGDLGFIYEYRPGADEGRNNSNYKVRISLSLLDVGRINYTRDKKRSASYSIHIPASQRFYLSSLGDAGIDNFKDTLDKYPQFFTNDLSATGKYNVSLPTTLHLGADYGITNSFFVNLDAQFALTGNQAKSFSPRYYQSVTVTPRLDGRHFGVFVPLGISSLTDFTGGVAFRLGKIYFGSGSVLSAVVGSSKQVDLFFGAHFGVLQKKKKPAKKVEGEGIEK